MANVLSVEHVELRQLRAFLVVAEELHFGRAADRLRVSPSRVSQLVRALETVIGASLFERTSRRVALTPIGERLRSRVGPACNELARAVDDLRNHRDGLTGELRLGVVLATNGGPYLPEIIGLFEARHPACRIVVSEITWTDPLGPLRRGEVDLTAIRFPLRQPDLVVGPVLTTDARALAVADDHPLAGRSTVCVEDLADYEVAAGTPAIPQELIDALLPRKTPSGRPIARRTVSGAVQTLAMVARGEIVHATVASLPDYMSYPGITYIPIVDLPPCDAGLVWRASEETPAIRAFAAVAREVVAAVRRAA
ncbi:MAG TPA: LysR family transcriptional regulator [Solirubrobacteraceae bacterium]|nr:LysR family transcriptional regulator [Solirubrobacteraceae bacterium]